MSDIAATRVPGRNAFFFVIVTVALDMMGFGLIVPVIPALLKDITDLSTAEVVGYGGALTATYALMNFLAGPTLGSLSDRFGRRPVLLGSVGALAVDFLIMGLAHTLPLLFLGRALAGISGATFSTANAYIADVAPPERRARAFGMVGAAFGVGFIIGPAVGGALGEIDPRAPFFAAAGLAGLNMVYGLFVLPESLPVEKRRSFDWRRANPFGAFRHFAKLPRISWFLLAMGIFALAHSVYPATWSFHGDIRYGWSEGEIGLSLALVGIGAAVVQAGLIGPLMARFGPARVAVGGFLVNLAALTGYAFAVAPWMAYAIIPFSALGGLTGPAVNTMLANATPDDAQGEMQGAVASVNALAMIVSPVLMTQTLQAFSEESAAIRFPGAAFLLAAALTGLAMGPLLAGLRANRDALARRKAEASGAGAS